jgi:putative ABC transport system permease protein
MDGLMQDLRFAIRSLRRTPGFTLTVVVMMALGIGGNAMIYSALKAILFADLPFANPERIVDIALYHTTSPDGGGAMSVPDALDVRDQAKTLSAVGLYADYSAYLAGVDMPERLQATLATDGLLATLGVRPLLGRWFTRDECLEGPNYVPVVIGEKVWRERYGRDPNVLGKTLSANGRVRTIVGVMPEDFRFPESSVIFTPMAVNDTTDTRGNHWLSMVGRLAPGATLGSARAELEQIAKAISREHVATNRDATFRPIPLREDLVGEIRPMLVLLALAVTFVLLIACANVANLLLARANARVRELGVRQAMGATRGRIIRMLLAESVLLSTLGGGFGVLLGEWGMRITLASIPIDLAYWMDFRLDFRVVAVVAVVSVLSGIVFGLAPAWQVTSGDLLTPLRESTPGGGDTPARRRIRNALVVAEVALAAVLLIGSGLMVRSFLRMQEQRSVLRTEHVLTARVTLPYALYPEEERREVFFRELRQAIAALPGVTGVGGVMNLHLGRGSSTVSLQREGIDPPRSADHPIAGFNVITPGYLDAVGLPLLRGRDLTESDGAKGANVVLVNQSAAKKLFPKGDAIGRRIRLRPEDDWSTIVGITADVRQQIDAPRQRMPELMMPQAQWRGGQLFWTIRTEGEPASVAAAVRAVVRARDPNVPIYDMRSYQDQIARSMWDTRMYSQLMGVFSLLALFIAALGIYGVMAYSVSQRTREIGIRIALGAARAEIQRMVIGQATRLTLLGLGIGLVAAFAVTRFMAGLLFGVRPDDPPTFGIVTILLAASAVLAAWLPTARAVQVDPVVALRHE